MKNPSEKLFKLIQSMSANEKNYFKRQTAAHNRKLDNEYLDVFDAIAKQKEYDEAALLKKFEHRDFIKQFAAIKSYLYKVVMQSLIDLYESKDIISQIYKMRSEARVLIERGLIKDGLQIYKKAQEKAQGWDLPILQLSLLLDEHKFTSNFNDFSRAEIDAFHAKYRSLTDLISNMSAYSKLYDSFIYWAKRERSLRDKEALAYLEEIIQSPKVLALEENTAFMSKLQYYSILERYAMIKGNYDGVLQCMTQLFALYDAYPQMKIVDEKNYFIICTNYLNTLYRLRKAALLHTELVKFEAMQFENPEISVLHFSRLLILKLALCEISGDCKDFQKIVTKIEEAFDNPPYELSTIEWRLLLYNIVNLYILQGDFQKAQDWVIRLLNLPKTNQQDDLQRAAVLLQILIHYQLGDEFLLEYLSTTIKRKMNQKNRLYAYEKLFLDLFHKLIHTTADKRQSVLKKFMKACQKLFQNESELAANNEYFNLQLWIEATLANKTMLALIQERRMS